MQKHHDIGMRHLSGKMQQSHQAEPTSVSGDELLVRTTLTPIIRHKEQGKAVEQHHGERKQAKPHIEFAQMHPHVGIGMDGRIYDACIHTDEYQQQQRGKQERIYQGTANSRTPPKDRGKK